MAEARALEASGLNRGSSGNVSARLGEGLLITPSAVPARELAPELLARIPLDGGGRREGPLKPSSEWRFHPDLMQARAEFCAIVHTHAPSPTVLAIARRPIPAVHHMIAAFGGPEIRCASNARYGTAALSEAVLDAMDGRGGSLMANHGKLVAGPTLARAVGLAHELEALARQYVHVLTAAEIAETAEGFAGYGVQGHTP